MSVRLTDPLVLPCGARLPNRVAKAAITEGLADARGWPTQDLNRLYEGWGASGFGLMISGNIIVDGDHLERPGNVVLERDSAAQMPALRSWTASAIRGDGHFWAQLSHSGRQTPKAVNRYPLSASDVEIGLPGGLFGKPQAMTVYEIQEVVDEFAAAASTAKAAGFTGVQIHAAHGYLISSFLSPKVNTRTDRWGGDLENRARLILETVRAVRERVGPGFPISVKLNSADFQRGGFDAQDSVRVAEWLEAAGVDLLEISGGSYESPVMIGATGISEDCDRPKRWSTVAREAYFLEFARALRGRVRTPIMLTGGLRSREGMQAALDEGVDVVGVARPVCVDPSAVAPLLRGASDRIESWEERLRRERGFFSSNSPVPLIGTLTNFAGIYWFYAQIYRLGRGKPADTRLWAPRAMLEVMLTEGRIMGQRKRLRRGEPERAEGPAPSAAKAA